MCSRAPSNARENRPREQAHLERRPRTFIYPRNRANRTHPNTQSNCTDHDYRRIRVNPARTTPSICKQSAAGIVAGTSIQTVLFVGALGSEVELFEQDAVAADLTARFNCVPVFLGAELKAGPRALGRSGRLSAST